MWKGLFGLFVAQLLGGGLLQVLLKIGLTQVPPVLLSSIRFFIATIGVGLLIYFSKKHSFSGEKTVSVIKRSFFFAANICLFAIGIQYTTVIMAQILYLIVPIFVLILGYFVLGEKITREKIVGLCIALIGLIFLMLQSVTLSQHLTFGNPIGNFILLISTVCWSIYLVFSRKISQYHSALRVTFINSIVTAVGLGLLSLVTLSQKPFNMHAVTALGILSIVSLGVGTVIQYASFQYGLKQTSAATASFFQYLSPFFAALFAIPVLHERITSQFILGGLLTLVGVFIATTYPLLRKSS